MLPLSPKRIISGIFGGKSVTKDERESFNVEIAGTYGHKHMSAHLAVQLTLSTDLEPLLEN